MQYLPIPFPGQAPLTQVEASLPPADCKCAWSYHGREFGDPGVWTLKYLHRLCPEHEGLESLGSHGSPR